MPRTRLALLAVALAGAACALANPLLRPEDGEPPATRLRAGIASVTLDEDCDDAQCTVQISLAQVGLVPQLVEIVEVRLVANGVTLGAVPYSDATAWTRGAYRRWDHTVRPGRSTRLNLELGPIAWAELLAPLGDRDPTHHEFRVEVVVAAHGQSLPVRSIFAVRPKRWSRSVIVT